MNTSLFDDTFGSLAVGIIHCKHMQRHIKNLVKIFAKIVNGFEGPKDVSDMHE